MSFCSLSHSFSTDSVHRRVINLSCYSSMILEVPVKKQEAHDGVCRGALSLRTTWQWEQLLWGKVFYTRSILQIPAKVKSYFNSVVQQGFASNCSSCMSLIECCNEDEKLKKVFMLIFEWASRVLSGCIPPSN